MQRADGELPSHDPSGAKAPPPLLRRGGQESFESKPQCPFLATVLNEVRADLETRIDPNALEPNELQALALEHEYTDSLVYHTKP